MLTEIAVPYYAKEILTLSAALTKADITPYHLGSSLPAPAEHFSPDITTKSAAVVKLLAALLWLHTGVAGPRKRLGPSKFALCRRSALSPLLRRLLEVSRVPTCEELSPWIKPLEGRHSVCGLL